MKTLKLALLLLLLPLLAGAQAGMTLRTANIIEEQKAAQRSALLRSVTAPEKEFSAMLSTLQHVDIQGVINSGAKVNTVLDGVVTVRATPSQLSKIAAVKGVSFIAADNRALPKLDITLPLVKADSVQLGGGGLPQAYTGKDVIVGVVDFGFNFNHPNFYDTAGKLRVARVWDMTALGFKHQCPGYYGAEYTTQEQMEQNLCSADDESHGTHVTGIAAGGGGKLKTYRGMAPDANIVMVQLDYGTDAEIIDAIHYVFSYAQSVGKPAVVNLSLGYHWGPHDGTSTMDKAIDQLSGPGKIIVGSAGNEGDTKLHAAHSFTSNNETMRTVVGATSTLKISKALAWAAIGKGLQWNVEVWDNDTKTVKDKLVEGFYSTNGAPTKPSKKFVYGNDSVSITADGGFYIYNGSTADQRAVVDVAARNTNPNKYSVVLALRGAAGESVHMWSQDDGNGYFGEFKSLNSPGTLWVDGDTDCTIDEIGGTSKSIISVGAYVTRKGWTNIEGENPKNGNETDNTMATFSSKGPTADGRMKPEIVAPGSMIISSVNSCDRNHGRYGADYDFVVAKEPQSNHYYAVMQGTSMAAPVVTGAVALLLQECPTLTPDSVRSILQRTANLDNTLAAYAPKVRGAGMLNALKAAQAVQGRACQAVVEVPFACKPTSAPKNSFWQNADELSFSIVPNPNSGAFTVQTEEQSELTLSVYNLWGVLVHRQTLPAGGEAQLQHLPQGVYVVQLSSSSMQGAQKMLIYR